jgi:hypothetical protein
VERKPVLFFSTQEILMLKKALQILGVILLIFALVVSFLFVYILASA